MPNLSRPLHRILVVAACLMFAETCRSDLVAAEGAGDLAQGRRGLNSSAIR